MNKLHKFLTANVLTAIFAVVAVLAWSHQAKATVYTVDQIVNAGKYCVEIRMGDYLQRSLPMKSFGKDLKIVKGNYTNTIIIRNLFGGFMDVEFIVLNEGGNTYISPNPDNDYVYYSSWDANSNTLASKNNIAYFELIPCTSTSYVNNGAVNVRQRSSYWMSDPIQIDSKTGGMAIPFTNAVAVKGYNSRGTLVSCDVHNQFIIGGYQPTATASFTKYTSSLSTSNPSSSETRTMQERVLFEDNGTDFKIYNFVEEGQGIEGQDYPGYNPPVLTSAKWTKGKLDFKTMTATIYNQAWFTRILADMTQLAPYQYKMCPVANPANPVYNATLASKDIKGDIYVDEVRHTGSDLWQSPLGGLKTELDYKVVFEPFTSYNNTQRDFGVQRGCRIKDYTLDFVEWKDVTLELKHEALTLVPGNTDDNLLPVNATASFSIAKNDMFVDNFDVYLVEGTSPKGDKAIFLGNVKKNNQNFYKIDTQFDLPSPDGKNWSTHKGESVNYPYTLKAIANYSTATSAPAADGKRMAVISLEPSNHGLGTSYLNFTVGVGGILSDGGVQVEATQNGVMVTAPNDIAVQVYNAAGSLVAEGRANSEILFAGNGVFIIKAGDQVRKLMK